MITPFDKFTNNEITNNKIMCDEINSKTFSNYSVDYDLINEIKKKCLNRYNHVINLLLIYLPKDLINLICHYLGYDEWDTKNLREKLTYHYKCVPINIMNFDFDPDLYEIHNYFPSNKWLFGCPFNDFDKYFRCTTVINLNPVYTHIPRNSDILEGIIFHEEIPEWIEINNIRFYITGDRFMPKNFLIPFIYSLNLTIISSKPVKCQLVLGFINGDYKSDGIRMFRYMGNKYYLFNSATSLLIMNDEKYQEYKQFKYRVTKQLRYDTIL